MCSSEKEANRREEAPNQALSLMNVSFKIITKDCAKIETQSYFKFISVV